MTSRFREVFRYELSYRLRNPITWVFFVLIWGGTLFAVHLSSTVGDRVVAAPVDYAGAISAFEFFLMFMTAWIFGDAAIRDSAHRVVPLFGTAPLTKFDYLGGRYAASFAVHTFLLLGFPLMVSLSMTFPWLSHVNWAPFRVMAFLQPFVILTLPNLLVRSAVIYTIAALTKNSLATYLGGVGLAVLYLIVVNNAWFSETVNNLLDPLAVETLNRLTRHWTPIEKETLLIGFPSILVANRLLWITFGAALLAFLHRKFSFEHPGLKLGRVIVQAPGLDVDEPIRHGFATVRKSRRVFDTATRWSQVTAVATHELRDIMRNRAFLVILAGAVVLSTIIGWQVGSIVFDTETYPVTHLMTATLNGTFVALMMIVILSLIAGEMVWRERELGAADISSAAPVPDWIPVVGRFIALVAIIVLLQFLFTVVSIGIQTAKGYYRYELGLYAKIMFGTQLVNYLIVASLTMAVHVVVNQKALSHLIVIAVWAFAMFAPFVLPVSHNLFLFNRDPGLVYSDLNGFGPFLVPWLWFKAYWFAWAILLTVVAAVFWVRSSESGMRARLRLARSRLTGTAGRAAAVAVFLVLATGGFVFWNTNVLNNFVSNREGEARRANYESSFKRYERIAVPKLARNVMHVEIYPERPALDVTGTWHLVNSNDRAIDTLVVSLSSEVRSQGLRFPGREVQQVAYDGELQTWVYAFREPIAPGDSLQVEFEVTYESRGFPNSGITTEVVSNGAYFDRRWLPFLGYQATRELTSDRARKKHGLPPRREVLLSPSDTSAAVSEFIHEPEDPSAHMDITIGTAHDQIAITPGQLVREWEEKGRKYYRYVTDTPVTFGAPILSGRFAVKRDSWRGRPVAVYYHPTHDFNIDRMIDAMKVSLELYSTSYGDYPYPELRVVEFPRYGSFARAHPYTVAFGEGSAFLTNVEEDDVDRTFMVVAHETAHMWFGNAVRAARLRGAPFVSETMAQYNAHLALEKRYGLERSKELYDFSMERYLAFRGEYSGHEWPLVEVTGQDHVYYFKGSVTMLTLRDLIGEANVSLALRRFYDKFSQPSSPRATSLDLVSELKEVAPDSLKHVVTDLFETVTLWNVSTDSVSAKQVGLSQWDVTLHVRAYKARADSIGVETEIPMKDLVEIGVYSEKSDEKRKEPIYLQRHWITSGPQTMTVRVGKKPVSAGIDPNWKLIDRERDGQVKDVMW